MMDTRDGRIYQPSAIQGMSPEDIKYMREMVLHPTPIQRTTGRVHRNDTCPCGSGKKFKKCCIGKAAE